MPEFKLVEFKAAACPRIPVIFYTKPRFCERVKMPGWNSAVEIEPKDNDPYCPTGGNQFLSTYNRWGHGDETDHFKSVTQEMLEQVKLKELMLHKPDNQKIVSLFTFEDHDCIPRKKPKNCRDCAPDFITTMQANYPMPFPCVIKPLTVETIPFLKNRKLKWEEDTLADEKFFDDLYIERIKTLQRIKGPRTVSYDPTKKLYSDGTKYVEKPPSCYPMDYKKYER